MTTYLLPQNDPNASQRTSALLAMKQKYNYDMTYGVPTSTTVDPVADTDGPVWVTGLINTLVGIRYNLYNYLQKSPFKFQNPIAPSIRDPLKFVAWLQGAIAGSKFSTEAFNYFSPDVGYGQSFNRATSIDDYKNIFSQQTLPASAASFDSDLTFARGFLAGPNPAIIRRLNQVPSNFPISDTQFGKLAAFQGDSLAQALQDGRVFYCDYGAMAMGDLENGAYNASVPKYTYVPIIAFAIPLSGGPLLPFAIQCGQSPSGREIYTPADGYSWAIAKNCVLTAHLTHHEVESHLGHTHLLIEPIAVATRRNLALAHPVYALLNHHIEGTMLINNGATHSMIQPGAQVDKLVGASMQSIYPWLAKRWFAYSFTGNYLPTRLASNQTDSTTWLKDYPYRDDALLLWNAIGSWASDFVTTFYPGDPDVAADNELQAWAAEIASPSGGMVRDFGATPGSIQGRQDLINILTMILFTASAQHAAVNFTQLTDMAFVPSGPLAGYTPEPQGYGHTLQDYLDNLPPMEVAICQNEILTLLASLHYTALGTYSGLGAAVNGAIVDFDTGPIAAALARFRANLVAIEAMIVARNTERTPYIHLLPSRIPQSINI